MGIKFRLTLMNFLQYAVWGAWLITLGTYCSQTLHFEGGQIATFYASMGIASLFMPAIMGVLADRFIPAQILLGVCHFLAAFFLIFGASQTEYMPLYISVLFSVMFYMPTIALSNSVAFNALNKANLDTVKAFPPIRVWGTIGFIAAMWFVSLVMIDVDHAYLSLDQKPSNVKQLIALSNSVEYSAEKPTEVVEIVEEQTEATNSEIEENSVEKLTAEFAPKAPMQEVELKSDENAVEQYNTVQMKYTPWQFYFSALLSILLGLFCLTLPACPVNRHAQSKSWIDTFGLRAFSLFKEPKMAIFFIFSMLLGMSLQITNAFADPYITNFGNIAEYAQSAIVKNSTILISLSQVSETLCILLIPFFLKRFGIKKVMLISMFAWVFRFGFLGAGDPGAGAWMLIMSMVVYGVAFDFFNISGSLFVDQETSSDIRSSAQGVFMIMTNGFGAFIGSFIAGAVVDCFGLTPTSWYIFAGYSFVVAVVFAFVFKYKHNPDAIK